jgi:pimeloyl-ACP methyl ester carboxylesterase
MKTAYFVSALLISGFSTLFAIDHSPVWTSATSITYNLRDLDNFYPLSYGYTRWGNVMDEVSSSIFDPADKWLDFTSLTRPHSSLDTDQDNWDLFLSGGSGSSGNLYRYLFPASPSIWNWDYREVGFYASGAYSLFRYLHFEPIPKDPAGVQLPTDKNKVIILIHGWNPDGNSDSYAGTEFTALYNNLTAATAGTDWLVFRYNWAADADTGTGLITDTTEAAENAHQHGQHLGDTLFDRIPNLTNVQIIAHSAGSWAARGTARNLLNLNPNIRVQVTLLDPFMPNELWLNDTSLDKSIISNLDETLEGSAVYLLENYFADDIAGGTQEQFSWNTNRGDINLQTDITSAPIKYDGHDGPIQWYADTVIDATTGMLPDLLGFDLATYGWRRSMFFNEPIITSVPEKLDVNIGANASLTISTTTRDQQIFPGDSLSPDIFYIWFKWNGTAWAGVENQTSDTLQFTGFSERDAGFYSMVALNQAGLSGTDIIEVSAITFTSWISQYPSIPENRRAIEDDFDEDGYTNLLEYALGMNPTVHSPAPNIDFQIEDNKLKLSYNRLRGDISYTVETSLNLVKWDSTDVNQETNSFGRITAWILKENEIRKFLRLRIGTE